MEHGKAIEILEEVGFDAIQAHEQELIRRLIDGLEKYDNITVYGDTEDISDRVGVVTFKFNDLNTFMLAHMLSEKGGVATRRGAFCAHPYVWRLMGIPDVEVMDYVNCGDVDSPGMIRVSFGIYNTVEEVDEFLRILDEILPDARAEQEKMNEKDEFSWKY